MTYSPQQPPPGWYPDPAGSDGERYWDGIAWSQATRDRQPVPPPYAPPQREAQYQGYQGPSQGYQGYGSPGGDPRYQGRRFAGFGQRLLGYIIDSILLGIATQIVGTALGLGGAIDAALGRWERDVLVYAENPVGTLPLPGEDLWMALVYSGIVGATLAAIYRTVLYGTLSATLGQLALGLRVVKADAPADSKLDWTTAAVRGIVSAVLYETIGFINGIFAAFTREKQTLGDLIARTHVLKTR
ncbi:hypothetical protein BCR15_01370 [Tessaracoccus lapidicaptus]|uniref:Uncharacterized protein n=1 Tax=Tessaracoccus lapidicaptus TaxID=1427523 RepID=A0A1C0AQH6_9ACTN|nr:MULTISPECIES: RDD family protein [Tessaracoccus]AQX15143.1 hypothetical protein BKM78_03780 [Tessaracoccus sp. T2.5-30]OCL36543.1 hypothetical protein BCR15_01370 [Tessaracoccus lapidicaptus]VEP39357.1 hypothetical protein TLA_TLA_00771 [Tessaracoccus lapidicaptus]